MCSSNKQQSLWKCPDGTAEPRLRLYNSFTKKKEPFVPISGNEVRWYSCGPTVYDTSHMGHARSYISFDILRRVIADYFGYEILYCMNITDIDDKIIKRARERYLMKKYVEDTSIPVEKVLEDSQLALKHVKDVRSRETDKDKQAMFDKQISSVEESLKGINSVTDAEAKRKKLFEDCRDILPSYLDFNYSHESNPLDNEVFLDLARHFESEYHKDMARLNILPADVLTRVSEYVPEIIKFIEKIIENGYAYESNSSVYFDTIKFHKQHSYAKLEPDRMGDLAALSEGEGALTTANSSSEKRNDCDFVLWKKSKRGEPVWQSPWGLGRPGWHIECSVMASAVLGPQFDIHTGGIDLKFPHHDNEIAQSEAHYDSDSWVNYFLHSGHLTIAGCKMSKSLKNFVTIQQALEKYTSRQIRLLFLLHSWSSTLDYSDNGMERALSYEKLLNEFFLNIRSHLRSMKQLNHSDAYTKFDDHDLALNERFSKSKNDIHLALCDSIDTPTVMEQIRQLVSATNIYMNTTNAVVNRLLLRNIAAYITRLINIFGLNSSPPTNDDIGFARSTDPKASAVNVEDVAMPYVQAFSDFRDTVRTIAITVKNKEILTECDCVRNQILPDLGVRLEDQAGGNKATIKFCDPEVLKREREQALLVEKSKQEEKERKKLEAQLAKEAKEAKKKASKEKKNPDSKNSSQATNGDAAAVNGAAAAVADVSIDDA